MWIPDRQGTLPDLFATTGDYLRVWAVTDTAKGPCEVNLRQFLNNNKNSEYCAPLTAFDWNDSDPNIIGTASIDTTCTIWDLSTGQAKTQLIAHDKEVYDIAFASRSVFGSVGAEGSVRLFDLRSLEHSTIIYETGQGTDSQKPLLRLAWNKSDPNFIATVPLDSDEVLHFFYAVDVSLFCAFLAASICRPHFTRLLR
jgi:WD repeat-containing protein 68